MTRLAGEEFAVAVFAGEFAIAHSDLTADGDHAGTAFKLPSLKRTVIQVHALGLHGNFAAIFRIEYHEVGVGARLDGAFAWEKIEGFGDLGAGDIHERVQVDLA